MGQANQKIESPQFIVYHKETASAVTHKAIDKKVVFLSKPVTYFREWTVEWSQDDGSVSTHQGVESGSTLVM